MSHGSNRMTKSEIAHPVIALREEWLVERKKHLGHEKDLTEHYDRVNAERRRLPMVKIEKGYVFDARMENGISKPCSTVAANLSSITSCSTQHGTRGARAARVW